MNFGIQLTVIAALVCLAAALSIVPPDIKPYPLPPYPPIPGRVCFARSPLNGHYTPANRFIFYHGQSITYHCKNRLVLNGKATATCQRGKWTSPTPSCGPLIFKTCPTPKNPNNGYFHPVQRTYFPGTTIWFKCNGKFVIKGQADITCGKTGRWSHPFPTCVGVLPVRCPTPRHPNNGYFHPKLPNYTPGRTIWFKCNPGSVIKGHADVTCGTNGRWSHPFPTCVGVLPVGCPAPRNPNNGYFHPKLPNYTPGRTIWFKCNPGSVIKGQADIKCGKNGRWSHPFPNCVGVLPVRCPTPRHPNNGYFHPKLPNYTPGRTIWFKCNPGSVIKGQADITCGKNGRWSHPFPTCNGNQIGCRAPPPPKSGYVHPPKPHFSLYEYAWYKCNPGFKAAGVADIRCLPGGKWSGRPITCLADGNPGHSCRGRCNNRAVKQPCSCFPTCRLSGTCCYDYEEFCPIFSIAVDNVH